MTESRRPDNERFALEHLDQAHALTAAFHEAHQQALEALERQDWSAVHDAIRREQELIQEFQALLSRWPRLKWAANMEGV